MTLEFSRYDSRNYKTVVVKDGYSIWSKSYEGHFDDALDMGLLNRMRSIQWQNVTTVADLACGTGRTGQWLVRQGVKQIDGVDLTSEMIAHAKRRLIYRQIFLEDIRNTSLATGAYDLVISSLAAEHLPCLQPLYREVVRLLRSGGYFILLGYHPHFQLMGIPPHFDNVDTGEPIAISNHIHLLSDFVTTGFDFGMPLVELDEYVVDEDWARRSEGMKKHVGHPISFLGVWRKLSEGQ